MAFPKMVQNILHLKLKPCDKTFGLAPVIAKAAEFEMDDDSRE